MRAVRSLPTLSSALLFLAACTGGGSEGTDSASGETGETTGDTGSGSEETGSGSGESTEESGSETGGGAPCSSEDDCFGDQAHCDPGLGECVGCTNDDDCRGETLCDVDDGICRDCVTDDDCEPGAPLCDAVSGQCTAMCQDDGDCAGTGGPDKCDTVRGVCVDCIGNGQDCSYCELETYSCVGCIEDADCPMDEPHCGPSYECSPACTSDDDCSGGLFCDPESSRCVECWKNLHCPGEICQGNYTCG